MILNVPSVLKFSYSTGTYRVLLFDTEKCSSVNHPPSVTWYA